MNKLLLSSLLFFQISAVVAQTDTNSESSIDIIELTDILEPNLSVSNDQLATENGAYTDTSYIDSELIPELFEDPDLVKEPEPTIADLLTPNRPESEALVELKAKILDIKAQKSSYENGETKRETRRNLFNLRSEKITIREQQLTVKKEKISLKKSEIERKLLELDITSDKRLRLEERLENVVVRENKLNQRLKKLELRSQSISSKLVKLEQQILEDENTIQTNI